MKFTEKSLYLLKNLSKINKAVMLRPGKIQRVCSVDDNMRCEVELDDEIPIDFGVYDLNRLLGLINSMEDYDLEFSEQSLIITGRNNWKVVYNAAAPELIPQFDDETKEGIANTPINLEFDLSAEMFSKMIKLAAVEDLPQIAFIDTPEGVMMKAFKKKVMDSSYITVPVTTIEKEPDECVKMPFIASTINLNIEPDSYHVMLAELGFGRFVSKTVGREYVVLTEMESIR